MTLHPRHVDGKPCPWRRTGLASLSDLELTAVARAVSAELARRFDDLRAERLRRPEPSS